MEAKYLPELSKLIQNTQAMAARSPSNPKIQNIKNQLVALYSLLKGKSKNVPMNIEILDAAEKRILLWLSKWNPTVMQSNYLQQQQQHAAAVAALAQQNPGMPMPYQTPIVGHYPLGATSNSIPTPNQPQVQIPTKPGVIGTTPHIPANYPPPGSAPIIPNPTPVPHPVVVKRQGYPPSVTPGNPAVTRQVARPPTPQQQQYAMQMPPADPPHVSPIPSVVQQPVIPPKAQIPYAPAQARPVAIPPTIPRTSKARLEKFVDLFCESSSQDTKVIVPALENILSTFQSGPGNPKDDYHHLNTMRDVQGKKSSFLWWDASKELNGDSLCGCKRPRQVLFIQSSHENECFQESELCWWDSKPPLKKRNLCHFSADFHLSYEQRKFKSMVKSDSSFVVEEAQDEQQNSCTHNKFFVGLRSNTADSDSKVMIEFAPVQNSTLPTDPGVPYLPNLSAHIQIQGQEQNYPFLLDTVGCLSLCKSINKRLSELKKELKSIEEFSVVFREETLKGLESISLECTLTNQDVPPIIINVPLNYPRVSAQCIFPKQYENVTHLQKIQETFESTILSKPFREVLTVASLLGVFQAVCDKILGSG